VAWLGLRGTDWLLIAAAGGLMTFGAVGVLVGVRSDSEVADARQFLDSPPAQRAQRLAAATATPIWLAPGPTSSVSRRPNIPLAVVAAPPQPEPATYAATPPAQPEPASDSGAARSAVAPTPVVPAQPAPRVRVVGSDFTFLDPPEPGAHAHLTVMLQNDEPQISPPLALAFASSWFGGYQLESSAPAVVADRAGRDRRRRLVIDGVPPGVSTLDFNFVSTAEGLEPPDIHLETSAGLLLGAAQPPTAAPPPRPGPVMALRIPRIGLSTAVVPTDWDPPPFLAGQLRDSAAVTLGNTVLVGHLTGGVGSVFAHLDQLEPGDQIVAISRGVEYQFDVTRTLVSAADDSTPTDPSDTPRLTLMTCTGTWDPLTRSYSDRLWIVAEPV
jgi:LPXTG-site transpeptidase (sortase) family protein